MDDSKEELHAKIKRFEETLVQEHKKNSLLLTYMCYRSADIDGIEGSGLGLALVKAVAESHGGAAGVTSTAGKGSVFTMRLPASSHVEPIPVGEV
jgi:K+-sensing histidine kinase KdpD